MNVQQAFERLKSARAYCGKNIYSRVPFHSGQRHELDQQYKDAIDTLEREHTASRVQTEALRRQNQVSHEFRAVADKRWEGSYTKKVVDAVRKHFPAAFNGDMQWTTLGRTVVDAAALLEDYHHTMHKVYIERGAARRLAESRGQANVELIEKLGNMGGLQNTHIIDSNYEPLLESIRRMKTGDTIGMRPAKLLLAKIAENDHILDRVKRAEDGELEAVKSREEARRLLAVASARAEYFRVAYQRVTCQPQNLPRYSINHEFETVNATPDLPRKAVHLDIYPPMFHVSDARLAYDNLFRYQRDAMAELFKRAPWSTPPQPGLANAAVDSAKRTLKIALAELQDGSCDTTPGIATRHIEKLIDAKIDSRRYQK